MRAWYRARARDYFAQRIDEISAKLPWIEAPPPFRLLEMSRQWGSCSPSGHVILNPHLVMAPRDCVDYVVIHELAHLKHHNHGPDFFKLLDQQVPRWEQHKRTLDNMVELAFSE